MILDLEDILVCNTPALVTQTTQLHLRDKNGLEVSVRSKENFVAAVRSTQE